jgi:hypothetical protein
MGFRLWVAPSTSFVPMLPIEGTQFHTKYVPFDRLGHARRFPRDPKLSSGLPLRFNPRLVFKIPARLRTMSLKYYKWPTVHLKPFTKTVGDDFTEAVYPTLALQYHLARVENCKVVSLLSPLSLRASFGSASPSLTGISNARERRSRTDITVWRTALSSPRQTPSGALGWPRPGEEPVFHGCSLIVSLRIEVSVCATLRKHVGGE